MATLNLLPWQEQPWHQWRQRIFIIGLSISLMVLSGYNIYWYQLIQRKRLCLEPTIPAAAMSTTQAISSASSMALLLDRWLPQLPQRLPESIYLRQIELNDQGLQFKGISEDNQDLKQWLTQQLPSTLGELQLARLEQQTNGEHFVVNVRELP